jgi:hypothetical protein
MIRNRQKKEEVSLRSPQDLDTEIKRLQIEKSLLLSNMFYSNSPEDIMKAQAYVGSHSEKKSDPKAYFFAPDYAFHSGKEYKEINTSVPDNILRKISYIHIIDSIINTKINQIMEYMKFSTDDQREGYTIQKKLSRFADRKREKSMSESEKKMVEGIVDFLEDGGINAKWDMHDNLRGFVGKILRDTFTFNRVAFELERNMKNELIRYVAIDAQTIRFLETIDPFFVAANTFTKMVEKEYDGKAYLPRYCQIWNGAIVENPITKDQVIWYPWQLAFEMRNPSTDIWRNGYPASEIEVLSNIITGLLNGIQYNANFFSQGSNPKGLLNVKNGDGGGQQILNQLRQMWSSSIAGVDNAHRMPVVEGLELEFIDMQHCLHGESEILLEGLGKTNLYDLLKDERETVCKIWDGLEFNEARVFKTQKKRICEVKLSNRLTLKTSPDHKFLILKDGSPTWVERKDVQLGDYVFVNKKSIDSDKKLFFNGKLVESDLFELIGWITGDGYIDNGHISRKNVNVFFHPEKELNIVERFIGVCQKYDINVTRQNVKVTKTRIKYNEEHNINSHYEEYPRLSICDFKFYEWLKEIGINSSKDGKTIPSLLYSENADYRHAFLRGLFSADGHISDTGNRIDLTVSNPYLRDNVVSLLMSDGIRCTSFKLKPIENLTFHNISEDNVLLIKDRDVYFEKIGFIQEYKQERELIRQKSLYKVNEAPIEFVRDLALKVKTYNKSLSRDKRLNKKDLHDLLNISRGYQKASLSKVVYYGDKIGLDCPEFIKKYNLEIVTELIDWEDEIEMFDVEMKNEEHQFCANGIIVHNSNKDMEFQLWNEFLIVLTCSVFTIDPSELGFQFKSQASPFGQDGQKERLNHSKDKGLKPILVFLQKIINKYVVSELSEDYEFKFTGVDIEDETQFVDNDVKKISAGFVSLEDMFEKYSNRKLSDKDTILNPVYSQQKQMEQQTAMYGGQQSNEAVDQQTGEPDAGTPNPFDEYDKQKSEESDPIWGATRKWLREKELIK